MFTKIGKGSTSPNYVKVIEDTNGKPVDLTDAVSIKLKMVQKDMEGETFELVYPMTIIDAHKGIAERVWEEDDTDYIGLWKAWIEITYTSGVQIYPERGEDFILIFEHEGVEIPPVPPSDDFMRISDYDVDGNLIVDYAETARTPIIVPTMPTTGKAGEVYYVQDIKEIIVVTEDF